MNQYKTYRNGTQTLAKRIGLALEHYTVHNSGALPAAVVVNPRDITAAGEILKALDLPTLQVVGNSGCMTVEVWLQNPPTPNLSKSAAKSPDLGILAQPGANGG